MENNFNNIPAEKFQFAKRNDLYHDSKLATKPVSYFQGAFKFSDEEMMHYFGDAIELIKAAG